VTDDGLRWDDSYSDGMCGYVKIKDSHTGRTEKVHWSVTGEYRSQTEAANEAKERLLKARTA